MPVKYVIWHSTKRAIWKDINAYTVESALTIVMCVIGHSVIRAILQNINAYIVVSTSIDMLFPDPCLLDHQFLQLWRLLILLHHCSKWEDAPPTQKGKEQNIKLNNLRIICRGPNVGGVMKNNCKNFGTCKYRNCLVIRMLDNLVPVFSQTWQVKRNLLH